MRIIAGKHRGRTLATFRGNDIRPTADRVKESLFQILSAKLVGARVLDLFCGSGALGLECLSRGAREAVFNDVSEESLAVLRKNLRALGESGIVTRSSYEVCLKNVSGSFGLIFCDPPYKANCEEEIFLLVKERKLLSEGGLIVFESEREIVPSAGFVCTDERRYGRTTVRLFAESRAEEEV